jgi:hypothetical protein
MSSTLSTSSARTRSWLSLARQAVVERRHRSRRQRQTVVAQAHGQTMLLDCQRHLRWWSGVVKIRDASAQERVVHVCIELRGSVDEALGDAEHDAQRLALMFAL